MKHEYLDKIKKQLDENKNCEVALFLLREEDSEEGAGVSVRIKSIFTGVSIAQLIAIKEHIDKKIKEFVDEEISKRIFGNANNADFEA